MPNNTVASQTLRAHSSQRRPEHLSTMDLCGVKSLFVVFLKTNEHQNRMRSWGPIGAQRHLGASVPTLMDAEP